MKSRNLSSTLSCNQKSIRFIVTVIKKKLIFGFFVVFFLSSCSSPSAMLGPAYTLSSTGNAHQAGLNYGSNQLVKIYTGKSTIENLKDINKYKNPKEINIRKNTLESEDFYFLVKNKIKNTSKILKLSNQ